MDILKNMGIRKGINFGGWFSQCDYSEDTFNCFITEDDFKKVASWGFDHVRIPVDYNVLENDEGGYSEDGFARISKAVEAADKYGLRVVLDLHKTAGFSFDKGENETGFFDSEIYQRRFFCLWEEIAKRFGDCPDTVAFELLNEVTESRFIDTWNKVAGECTERIRTFAPDTAILVGSYHNNAADAVKDLAAPYDDKVIYNFHCYEPLKFTHQGAYWTDAIVKEERYSFEELNITPEYFEDLFAGALEKGKKENTRLYCGEFGVIDVVDPAQALKWFRTIGTVFNKYSMARALWCYKGLDFALSEKRMDRYRDEIISSI